MAKAKAHGKRSIVWWAILLVPVGVVLVYLAVALADGAGFGPNTLPCKAVLQEVISGTPGVTRADVDCRQYPTYLRQTIVVRVAASDEQGVRDTAAEVLRRMAKDPRVQDSWSQPEDFQGADGRSWGDLSEALQLGGFGYVRDVRRVWGIEPK